MYNAEIDIRDKVFNASFNSNGAFDAQFGSRIVTEIRDYEQLDNLPQIEGVTLIGNKTFPQLHMNALSNSELEELLTL